MDNEILLKEELAPSIKLIEISTPRVAERVKTGQFIVLMIDERGERIPLTVADWDRGKGTIYIVFQEVGTSTRKLGLLDVGDRIPLLSGPLGNPSEIQRFGVVVCVGGGVGVAAIYPIARELRSVGNHVISIIGARSSDLLIFEEEMEEVSDEVYLTTDDGSKGRKGFVTDALKELIEARRIDRVIAVGPAIMMKATANLTRGYGVKTIASLNPIMLCGMAMCGTCRVTVGGETKFVCLDGPEFDAHQVDFDELLMRLRMYKEEEKVSLEALERGMRL